MKKNPDHQQLSGNCVITWHPKNSQLEINVSGIAYDKSIFLDDTQTKSLLILLERVFRKQVGHNQYRISGEPTYQERTGGAGGTVGNR